MVDSAKDRAESLFKKRRREIAQEGDKARADYEAGRALASRMDGSSVTLDSISRKLVAQWLARELADIGLRGNWPTLQPLGARQAAEAFKHYFFLGALEEVDCASFGAKGDGGEAAAFGCFGFLASRVLRFCPLAMNCSLDQVTFDLPLRTHHTIPAAERLAN